MKQTQSPEQVVLCRRARKTIPPNVHHPNPIQTVANDDPSSEQPLPTTGDASWHTTLAAARRVLDYHSSQTAQQPAQADQPDEAEPLHAATD